MASTTILETKVLRCDPNSIHFGDNSSTTAALPDVKDAEALSALQTASQILHSSSLVVFPTETVYGLAANALSASAATSIFTTKGRPQDNPLIVHVSSISMLFLVISPTFVIPRTYEILMRHFWPGPLTLLFPANESLPTVVTAGLNTVAVRFPSHPVARALIALSGLPLAAPSANTSGRPSPTRAVHVRDDLGGRVQLILDGGECGVGVESTVVDGLGGDGHLRVLRPGGVTVEDLRAALEGERVAGSPEGEFVKVLVHRKDYVDEEMEKAPTTPGMKYRHYSPTCPVYLLMSVARSSEAASSHQGEGQTVGVDVDVFLQETVSELETGRKRDSLRIGLLTLTDSPLTRRLSKRDSIAAVDATSSEIKLEWVPHQLGRMVYGTVGAEGTGTVDMAEPARRLFDGLISLDAMGVDAIFVEGVSEQREGLAVMNRLRKAAGKVCWLELDAGWIEEH